MLPNNAEHYCQTILQSVSRSFALGIGLLKYPISQQVMISYLICRILDTIEDSTQITTPRRVEFLERCADELLTSNKREGLLREIGELFSDSHFQGDEYDLMRNANLVMEVYDKLAPKARSHIPKCIVEMARGMALTIKREEAGILEGLETKEDLYQYCHYVAGTVGSLLTKLFAEDRVSITEETQKRLEIKEEEFGLALQMTNILKGIFDDYQRGVVYLPKNLLKEYGLTPESLFKGYDTPKVHDFIDAFIDIILPLLDQAIEYTLAIPEKEDDIRMFCALPILIACRTLKLARNHASELLSGQPLKIRRNEVKEIHVEAEKVIDNNAKLRMLLKKERGECDKKPVEATL